MKTKFLFILSISLLLLNCGNGAEGINPKRSKITESVYSSGIIKSKDQYQLYPKVSGKVEEVLVEVGDSIHIGDILLIIENEVQQISNQNAQLSEQYYSQNSSKEQLRNLENSISVAKQKKEFDSLQYIRQKKLFNDGVGIEVDLEISKLNYENSVINYNTALNQLAEFNRQLKFNASTARNNVRISSITKDDFIIRSEINGLLYSLDCAVGELVGPQRPLGVIGSSKAFILEMLIDESDIMDIHLGQQVIVSLDSYEDTTFEAFITKVYPLMDISSKSFKIEAEFVSPPEVLYPNMNFEANIIVNSKEDVLLIPREYLVNETYVILENEDTVQVETGLKDYQMVEILSGIKESDRIILPEE